MSYVRSIIDELRKELDSVRVPVDLLAACPQRQGIDQNGNPSMNYIMAHDLIGVLEKVVPLQLSKRDTKYESSRVGVISPKHSPILRPTSAPAAARLTMQGRPESAGRRPGQRPDSATSRPDSAGTGRPDSAKSRPDSASSSRAGRPDSASGRRPDSAKAELRPLQEEEEVIDGTEPQVRHTRSISFGQAEEGLLSPEGDEYGSDEWEQLDLGEDGGSDGEDDLLIVEDEDDESDGGVWDDMEGLSSGADLMAAVGAKEERDLALSPRQQKMIEAELNHSAAMRGREGSQWGMHQMETPPTDGGPYYNSGARTEERFTDSGMLLNSIAGAPDTSAPSYPNLQQEALPPDPLSLDELRWPGAEVVPPEAGHLRGGPDMSVSARENISEAVPRPRPKSGNKGMTVAQVAARAERRSRTDLRISALAVDVSPNRREQNIESMLSSRNPLASSLQSTKKVSTAEIMAGTANVVTEARRDRSLIEALSQTLSQRNTKSRPGVAKRKASARRMRHSALGAPSSFDSTGTLGRWGVPPPESHFGVSTPTFNLLRQVQLMKKDAVRDAKGVPEDWSQVKTVADAKKRSAVWKAGSHIPLQRAHSAGIRRRPASAQGVVVKDLTTPAGRTVSGTSVDIPKSKASRLGTQLAAQYGAQEKKQRPQSAHAMLSGSSGRTNGSCSRG